MAFLQTLLDYSYVVYDGSTKMKLASQDLY